MAFFWTNPRFSNPHTSGHLVVLTQDDLEEHAHEALGNLWAIDGGYFYKMTYDVVTPESAETGEAAESGWKNERSDTFATLEELLRAVQDHNWLEWSSTQPRGERDWLISEAEQNLRTGEDTSYHLFIKREDGKPLVREEMDFINEKLHVG